MGFTTPSACSYLPGYDSRVSSGMCTDPPSGPLSSATSFISRTSFSSSDDVPMVTSKYNQQQHQHPSSDCEPSGVLYLEAHLAMLQAQLKERDAEVGALRATVVEQRSHIQTLQWTHEQQLVQVRIAAADNARLLEAQVEAAAAQAQEAQHSLDQLQHVARGAFEETNAEMAALREQVRHYKQLFHNALETAAQEHADACAEIRCLRSCRPTAEELADQGLGRAVREAVALRCTLRGMCHFTQLPTSGPGVKNLSKSSCPLDPTVVVIDGPRAAAPLPQDEPCCGAPAAAAASQVAGSLGVCIKAWSCAAPRRADDACPCAPGVMPYERAIREAVNTLALASDPRVGGSVPEAYQLGVVPCSPEARRMGCELQVVLVTPAGRGDVWQQLLADVKNIGEQPAARKAKGKGRGVCGVKVAAVVQRIEHYARGMLESMAAIHSTGMLLEDAKPENSLVREDGTIGAIDLEALRQANGACASVGACAWGHCIGTPGHLAPEREPALPAAPYSSPRSDVYAMGVSIDRLVALACDALARCGLQAGAQVQATVRAGPLGRVMRAALQRDDAMRPTVREALGMLQPAAMVQ